MEIFHMSDVVSLLGIPMPPSGRSSYYVQCPCCDENPRKRHLNINLKKKCIAARGAEYLVVYLICTHYIPGFRVTKCGKALVEKLGMPDNRPKPQKRIQPQAKPECPITDVDTRHATYSALLDKLTLAADHKENLLGRVDGG